MVRFGPDEKRLGRDLCTSRPHKYVGATQTGYSVAAESGSFHAEIIPRTGSRSMPGQLSTHVLDTAAGRPAAGLRYRLYAIEGDRRVLVAEAETNADGRAPAPLLTPATIRTGPYSLEFDVAAYHRRSGVAVGDPPFLDIVTLRFNVGALDQHYHVPLLLSPFGYTTYRGS
jgi:5-hydroxyisourate hydrolase